jgi:hypothetical protein
VDLKKLEEKENAIKSRKEKEERIKLQKEEEKRRTEEERLLNGNKGKGETKDYLKFCNYCFVEYEINTIDQCTHCGHNLMTREVSIILTFRNVIGF